MDLNKVTRLKQQYRTWTILAQAVLRATGSIMDAKYLANNLAGHVKATKPVSDLLEQAYPLLDEAAAERSWGRVEQTLFDLAKEGHPAASILLAELVERRAADRIIREALAEGRP